MIDKKEVKALVERLKEIENDDSLKRRANEIFDIDEPWANGRRQVGETRFHLRGIDWHCSYVECDGTPLLACLFDDGWSGKTHYIPANMLEADFDMNAYRAKMEERQKAKDKAWRDERDAMERKEYERLKAKFEKGV